jgi:hypothetical protein
VRGDPMGKPALSVPLRSLSQGAPLVTFRPPMPNEAPRRAHHDIRSTPQYCLRSSNRAKPPKISFSQNTSLCQFHHNSEPVVHEHNDLESRNTLTACTIEAHSVLSLSCLLANSDLFKSFVLHYFNIGDKAPVSSLSSKVISSIDRG